MIRNQAGALAAILLLWMHVTIAATAAVSVSVVAKWLLLGKVTAGAHDASGWFAARMLIVDNLVTHHAKRLLEYAILCGSPLAGLGGVQRTYLRMLGVKVGKSTEIARAVPSVWTSYDLLTVGDECFSGNLARFRASTSSGPVTKRIETCLGPRCYLGTVAFVAPGTRMEPDSAVAAYSRTT